MEIDTYTEITVTLRCGHKKLRRVQHGKEAEEVAKFLKKMCNQCKKLAQREKAKITLKKNNKKDDEALDRRIAWTTEMDKRKGETGWTLMAGEDTDVLARGTYDEIITNMWKVTSCPVDPHEGVGCYVILAPDGGEYASGKFDKHCYY